jgi:protein-S-isoprenylcysteine O-methyltransferase Ste14
LRFFSKIVFICNGCFVASAIFRLMEKDYVSNGNNNAVIPLQAVEGTLVILGFVAAVILNVIFALLCLIYLLLKKQHNVAKWLVWINLLFLLFQLFYFKLY